MFCVYILSRISHILAYQGKGSRDTDKEDNSMMDAIYAITHCPGLSLYSPEGTRPTLLSPRRSGYPKWIPYTLSQPSPRTAFLRQKDFTWPPQDSWLGPGLKAINFPRTESFSLQGASRDWWQIHPEWYTTLDSSRQFTEWGFIQ
jgi:hypothetical protein